MTRDALWGRAFGGGSALGRGLRRSIKRAIRTAKDVDRRVFTLPAVGNERGRVLLAYIVRGFFEAPDSVILRSHTHYWESMEIAKAWAEQGFRVDVIDNYNDDFRPAAPYDVIMGARMALEPMSNRIKGSPLKILHADTCHWLTSNGAQFRRLAGIQERRGVSLEPRKLIEVNRALEVADAVTVLGNEFTIASYGYGAVPTHRVPLSSVSESPWRDRDWEKARRSFVWFGSQGLVHKGLDLVLEVFAKMPDLTLYVCGPIEEEKDFVAEYQTELYETSNIHTIGWVDVKGARWAELVQACGAVVFPSCAEGGAGSVLACMHAGLSPVVTASASVDVEKEAGVLLIDDTVSGLVEAVAAMATEAPAVRETRSRMAWEQVGRTHTRNAFSSRIREVVATLARETQA